MSQVLSGQKKYSETGKVSGLDTGEYAPRLCNRVVVPGGRVNL